MMCEGRGHFELGTGFFLKDHDLFKPHAFTLCDRVTRNARPDETGRLELSSSES